MNWCPAKAAEEEQTQGTQFTLVVSGRPTRNSKVSLADRAMGGGGGAGNSADIPGATSG